jgi:DnaJ-class molecular chaperone
MRGEVDCEKCGGTGDEPGEPGFWLEGIFYSGKFPCGDCNGSGKQPIWLESCKPCGGRGVLPGGADCPRCNGLGFHEAEPASKVSRWEEVIDY